MDDSSQLGAPEAIRAAVADRYSAIGVSPSSEETIPVGRAWAVRLGYPAEVLDTVPATALASFTGIGAPLFVAHPERSERVLDLGCGAGLDSILIGKRVGPGGRVYGVDLAPGMVAAACRAVEDSALKNVSILEGSAEQLPLPNESVDVAVVNGLFNLTPDKHAVVSELARTIRSGGRFVGAEIVLTEDQELQHFDPDSWFR